MDANTDFHSALDNKNDAALKDLLDGADRKTILCHKMFVADAVEMAKEDDLDFLLRNSTEFEFELEHLHTAIEEENPGVLRTLLHYGAPTFTKENDDGHTTVWYALYYAINRYSGIFKHYEQESESNPQSFESKKSCIRVLLDADTEKKSTLITAIESDWQSEEMVSTLIDCGADVNFHDRAYIDATPLMIAAEVYVPGNRIMADLLTHGADINGKDRNGETALMFAGRKDNLQSMLWLIENGADMFAFNNRSENFLEVLRYDLYLDLLPGVIGKGIYPGHVRVDVMNKYENNLYDGILPATPLTLALWRSKTDIVKLLMELGFLTGEDIKRWPDFVRKFESIETEHNDAEVIALCPVCSLELMAFVKVSDSLGIAPNRTTKITQVDLPRVLQERLLFKRFSTNFKMF